MAYEYDYRSVDADLLDPPRRLAREVDTTAPDYLALRESIRAHGQRDAIEVVERDGTYTVIDGMHRLTALGELGIEQARVKVRVGQCAEVSDSDMLTESLTANIQRIEQRPVDCGRALRLILDDDPGLTIADLARRIGRSSAWIGQALKIAGLAGAAGEQVNTGAIPIATGVALARLQRLRPEAITEDLLDRARRLPSAEVGPEVAALAKQARGEKAQAARLLPKYRPLSDTSAELERSRKQETPCYTRALEWALRQDSASIAECVSDEPCPLFAALEPPPESGAPESVWQAALAAATPEELIAAGAPSEVIWAHESRVMQILNDSSPEDLDTSPKTLREWLAGRWRPSFAQRMRALGLIEKDD